jgi:transposase
MVGNQDRWNEDIFVACPLRDLVPDDHILKRVDRVLDLSWLRDEVADCYCPSNGRPSVDPEAAVRLMLAGFFAGIVHDRKLMREAQVNLAMRWFAGYRLHEQLPDHSSLTRIRQRWGEDRFKRIFQRTVQACEKAGLVDGETVHVDATLIRADVSWESVIEKHAEQVIAENSEAADGPAEPERRKSGRPRTRPPKVKRQSQTDPEATLATSSHDRRMEFSYKQHTAVDDKAGVVVDIAVTTGQKSEGSQLLEQVERIQSNTGKGVKTLTADAGYAHTSNYAGLEERGIEAVIPPQHEPRVVRKIPARRFKYDERHHQVRCPRGKRLRRGEENDKGWIYRARGSDCRHCPLRERCLPASGDRRSIPIVHGYEALLRARRRRARGWDDRLKELYHRHQWRVEGKHGEAKVQHGLRRAVRRGRWNVAIQAYLTAAAMNLKCLAALLLLCIWSFLRGIGRLPLIVGQSRRVPASSPA